MSNPTSRCKPLFFDIDNAVSKTINLPNDYPVEDFKDMLLEYAPNKGNHHLPIGITWQRAPHSTKAVDEAVSHLQSEGIEVRSEADAKFLEDATSEMACPDGVCEIPTPSTETVAE